MLHVPHLHAYAGCMHAAHTPLHMSYTHCLLVTFTLHTPNMPQTCLMRAAHALHTCHLPAKAEHFPNAHIHACTGILHASTPQACCTYTVSTHNVCMLQANNTRAAHMPHSPASQMPHMLHAQVCCRHAKDTNCVHVGMCACMPHSD
jgi:hypothetical protein